ncbi:winged helix-turn-helix domain-containing protein [Dictyobacter aurantiacus]|uniref:DNA-binding response regulator n=1 Tax=Dictyobacter aurantiacus TaxID=1936993 RepID=A0A401ZCD2_9CHLR|nr:response regulator transcription factor [Dictyobacter aurantiacus]GCE04486.1 DNA-binding response regulator [Dictyobacter aurantiacus]
MPRTILVVVKDKDLRQYITTKLQEEAYVVQALEQCCKVVELVSRLEPSLVIFDVEICYADQFATCRDLRTEHVTASVPQLLLVHSAIEITRIERSEVQIDDYVVQPIWWQELLACVHTLARSGKRWNQRKNAVRPATRRKMVTAAGEQQLSINGLVIDIARHQVIYNERCIELQQPILFDLLLYLVRHQGVVLSRERLLQQVWGYEQAEGSRTVDVHIRWLRQKLEEDPSHPRLLQTVRGVGYCFKV